MTIDTNELRRLAQAVSGCGCCNQAWLDQSEDTPAAVVGHINEDGETYPVVTIDCDQYSAAGQSLPLGKFYAAANPAVINELLDRLEDAEAAAARDKDRAEIDRLQSSLTASTSAFAALEATAAEARRNDAIVMSWISEAKHAIGYEGDMPGFIEALRALNAVANERDALPSAPLAPSFADAYQGARECVAIWKKRALEAEDLNRKFVAEINGPAYMGEPAQPAPSVPEAQ